MIHAYFDESGQRGPGVASSPTFLLGGVVVRDKNARRIPSLLEKLRADTGRKSGQHLHFNKLRTHPQRLHVSKTIGEQTWLRSMCVVASKKHLPRGDLSDDQVYLFQLRMLLERLSWFARSVNEKATFTLAHIQHFRKDKLREYEDRLRSVDTNIDWGYLDDEGGRINTPQRLQELQLADSFISAVGCAFNPDDFGNTEDRYLRELRHCFYRHSPQSSLTSYGLKMHPWNAATKLQYDWLKDL